MITSNVKGLGADCKPSLPSLLLGCIATGFFINNNQENINEIQRGSTEHLRPRTEVTYQGSTEQLCTGQMLYRGYISLVC